MAHLRDLIDPPDINDTERIFQKFGHFRGFAGRHLVHLLNDLAIKQS